MVNVNKAVLQAMASQVEQVVQVVKSLLANAGDSRDQEMQVWSLGQEDPLEKEIIT